MGENIERKFAQSGHPVGPGDRGANSKQKLKRALRLGCNCILGVWKKVNAHPRAACPGINVMILKRFLRKKWQL
jgi:hypothetical protein